MLSNVLPVEDLRSLARRKNSPSEFRSVPTGNAPDLIADGWQVYREGAVTTRLIRPKTRSALLEDRVWSLLYKLGFTHLSGEGGAQLLLDPKKDDGSCNLIDVVGLDPEVAVAVKCKSARQPRRYSEFQKDIAGQALLRQKFANSVSSQFPVAHKRASII